MDAIPIYEFGSIIKTLEKRFKKLSVDQQEIYYDRLKHTKAETLKKAVIHFVDNAPHFPTPGEVIKKCRDFDNDEYKAGASRCLPPAPAVETGRSSSGTSSSVVTGKQLNEFTAVRAGSAIPK